MRVFWRDEPASLIGIAFEGSRPMTCVSESGTSLPASCPLVMMSLAIPLHDHDSRVNRSSMVGPMDDPPIVASGIGFSYEKPVVQGFSLSVGRGEVVAMLGTNGAGKTTIVRMLCGDLR